MTNKILAIMLSIFLVAKISSAQVISIKDTTLTYSDLFLSGEEYKKLEPVDQMTYLMALSFLTYTNQILHAPNLVSDNTCLPDQIQNSKSKWSLFYQAAIPPAHAILALVRLALTPAVRAQLTRVAGVLSKGTQSVNKIATARLASKNLAEKAVKIKTEQSLFFNLTAKRASLAKNPKKNSKALADIDAKLTANKAVLKQTKAEFKNLGGTNHQMFKIVEEAKKSKWTKLKSFAATGLGAYGAFELADHWFFPNKNEQTGPIENANQPKVDPPTYAKGEPCLYGLYPSTYSTETSFSLKCDRPKESKSSMCTIPGEDFLCPTFGISIESKALTARHKVSKLFCVKNDPLESLSQRCLETMLSTMKRLSLVDGLSVAQVPDILNWDQDKAMIYVNEMHAARFNLVTHNYFNGDKKRSPLKISEYCEAYIVRDEPTQQAECKSIETFLSAVHSTRISDIFFSRDISNAKPGGKTDPNQTK
jgi:hypothetical protein